MPTTILHEEKAPHSISMKVILGLTLLLLFVATILSLVNTGDKTEFKIVAFTSIIIAFIFRSYFNMHFTVSTDRVEATMAPFSYSVKHDEIEDVYIDNVPWWMGWGLRIGGDGLLLFHSTALQLWLEKRAAFSERSGSQRKTLKILQQKFG